MRLFLLLFLALPSSLLAQTATLRGVVTDATGAVIPSAIVEVSGPGGARSTTTASDGSYVVAGLQPGDYSVQASAPNMVLPQPAKVALSSAIRTLNLQLRVATITQQVEVAERDAPVVNTDAAGNATAKVITGGDLDALSDDPEDLLADLQALAGPSAGPNGGSIFVDGFSGGQLPPKETIREIRINQNPFSAEYDRIGLGRIEILTKPGTDKYRGTLSYNHMGDFWNSRNPYAAQKAPLQLNEYRANLSGPLNRHASFTFDFSRDAVDNGSIVNAVTLDPATLAVTPFTAVPVTPQRRFQVNPKMDYQLSPNHTLSVHYQFSHSDIQDAGIGSFDLLSRAYHTPSRNQSVHLIETAVLSPTTVNETGFQYNRSASEIIPNLISPTIQVLGSFNGGGTQNGHAFNTQINYELRNYTTMIRGGHVVKFGFRARWQSSDTISPQNYNGTFTFGGGQAPVLDANNQPVLDSSGQPVLTGIQSIERYRRTLLFEQLGRTPAQIRALGGGAAQFSITSGIPAISGSQTDVGIFVGDDWKIRPNFTLNLGARYEAQSNLHDWQNWAPRIGLAWVPGGSGKKQPKTVFRAGFGMFYDRFGLGNTLTARRSDGIIQQQYVVTNPDFFPTIPAIATLAAFQTTQVTRQIDSNLHAPVTLQSAFTVERELWSGSTLAVTYTASRGVHMLRSLDINAPLAGVFPLGNSNPLFLMTSSGIYSQRQLTFNVTAKVSRAISMTGSYALNRARSNTDGLGTFPANPYDYSGEYGPASSDTRHIVSINGAINTKWAIRFSPLLSIQSGAPFDVTSGSDLYGTTLFNGRPGIATDPARPGVIATKYGLLDPNPAAGEQILSRNYGRGPGQVSVNLRVSKAIGFGPDTGTSSGAGNNATTTRRYNMSISMSARNILNHTNPGPIIGNITSPLFGRANQMAGGGGGGFSENANNRRLEMQLQFRF